MIFKKKTHPKKSTRASSISTNRRIDAHPVGIVIDGKLQDIMFCDERMQALVLSSPTFLDLELLTEKPNLGDEYDFSTGTFKKSE